MPDAPPPNARPRLFVVDDHAFVREMIADFLTTVGDLEVHGTAGSGAEALEALPAACCDLAIIDVSMPGMSGIELVRRLRVACPELKCLMLSGHTLEAYATDALRAGAHGYVAKGNPDTLLAAIRAVLRGERYVGPLLKREG